MRLEVGSVVNRSYRLLHPIGEGGMSRVWVAEQLALERRVAIKVLAEGVIRTAEGLELFRREARATARVDHPHVVRIVDFGVSEAGAPFLVFELLVGETLEQRVRRGPIDLDEARSIFAQTCDALAFAHERGVLHRDIKAENLFLQQARSGGIDVKLVDFGIALRKSAPATRDPGVVGTPAYMSPEQLGGRDVDERSDLFSLGVCMYYALSRRFPYPGDGPTEAARSLAKGTFVPMSALRPDLPPALDEWFARAFATDRAARFGDARSMLAAFERVCQPSQLSLAVDVSGALPAQRSSLPWRKAALAVVAVATLAFVRVTPARVSPIAHAPALVVAPPATVVPTATATAIATSDAIPVEMLPRAAPKKSPFAALKPQRARPDAGVATIDPIPEFGDRE